MKKIFAIACLICLIAGQVWATDYYVDSGCAAGTAYDPTGPSCTGGSDVVKQTVAQVNALMPLSPGDNVYFRKGQSWSGTTLLITSPGTLGSPVVIGAFGTGALPRIIQPSTTSSAISFGGDTSYTTVEYLRVEGGNNSIASFFHNLDNLTIKDSEFVEWVAYGIRLDCTSATGDSILVQHNIVDSKTAAGAIGWNCETICDAIRFTGSIANSTITENYIEDCGHIAIYLSTAAGSAQVSTTNIISYNYVKAVDSTYMYGVSLAGPGVRANKVFGNKFEDVPLPIFHFSDASGSTVDTPNLIFNNVSFDNGNGWVAGSYAGTAINLGSWKNFSRPVGWNYYNFFNNTFVNSHTDGMRMNRGPEAGQFTGNRYVNNIFLNPERYGIAIEPNGSETVNASIFYNNIVFGSPLNAVYDRGSLIENAAFDAWTNGIDTISGNRYINPSLNAAGQSDAYSDPAVNAGHAEILSYANCTECLSGLDPASTWSSTPSLINIVTVPRGAVPAIGAYEYEPGTIPPPPPLPSSSSRDDYMPVAYISKTYDSAGGADYTALATWEAAWDSQNYVAMTTLNGDPGGIGATEFTFADATPGEDGKGWETGDTFTLDPGGANEETLTVLTRSTNTITTAACTVDHANGEAIAAGVVLRVAAGAHNDSVIVAGATTTSSYFTVIRAADGATWDGVPAVDGSVAAFVQSTATNTLQANDNNVHFMDLVVKNTYNKVGITRGILLNTNAQDTFIIGCAVVDCNNADGSNVAHGISTSAGAGFKNFVINSLAKGNESYGFVHWAGSGYFYNCVASANGDNYNEAGGTMYMKNCISNNDVGTNDITNGTHNLTNKAVTDGDWGDTWATGTTTSASAGKLVDTGADFSSVQVGSIVKDGAANTSYVTALDSGTTLSVNDDIFGNAEAYTVYTNMFGAATFVSASDWHLALADTTAKDKGTDLSADAVFLFDDDIDVEGRPSGTAWDVGLDEYDQGTGTPTILAVGGITDPDGTPSFDDTITATWNTAGASYYFGVKLSESCSQYGNPQLSRFPILAGPGAADVTYVPCYSAVTIAGYEYLIYKWTLAAGKRSTDLNTGASLDDNGGQATLADGDSNPLTLTIPDVDLGSLVISVPFNSSYPLYLGSGANYATFTAWDTATASVPDDYFKFISAITDNINTDAAGTAGHPITVDGNGKVLTGTLTVDQPYWTFKNMEIK